MIKYILIWCIISRSWAHSQNVSHWYFENVSPLHSNTNRCGLIGSISELKGKVFITTEAMIFYNYIYFFHGFEIVHLSLFWSLLIEKILLLRNQQHLCSQGWLKGKWNVKMKLLNWLFIFCIFTLTMQISCPKQSELFFNHQVINRLMIKDILNFF